MENQEKTFTQTELDSIVSERVNREKGKFSAQIDELSKKTSEYETQIANYTNQFKELSEKYEAQTKALAEKDAKIQSYELQSVKLRVSHEFGIPYELASRLNGTNEDEIKKDAELMKNVIGTRSTVTAVPLKNTEETISDKITSSFKAMSESLRK